MSTGLTRKIVLGGGAALVAIGALAGCSPTKEKEAPSTTSTPTSSSVAAVTPTEKAAGGSGHSFSPSLNPVPPGAVCKSISNGVCTR